MSMHWERHTCVYICLILYPFPGGSVLRFCDLEGEAERGKGRGSMREIGRGGRRVDLYRT